MSTASIHTLDPPASLPAANRTIPAAKTGMSPWYLMPIVVVHAAVGLAFVPWLFSWSGLVIGLVGTHVFGTLGINLGYHRLLTHRSLEVPKWLERFFSLLAISSLQDTPVRWVSTHRLHHVHSDDAEDPHSPRDGFTWAHIGWILRDPADRQTFKFYDRYARDLLVDPFYMFLEKQPVWVLVIYAAHLAVFGLAGFACGLAMGYGTAESVRLGASWALWGGLIRTVIVWHMTWCVNSVSHMFGYRNYETGENSRNNWFVSLIAAGEGWHNNHHHDPCSASVQHRWWEIDITYYVILLLSAMGLAWNIVLPRHVRQARRATRG